MSTVPSLYAIDNTEQLITVADAPQNVKINTSVFATNFTVNTTTGVITCTKSGRYFYCLAPQCGRVGVGQSVVPNIRVWLQKNSTNVANSNTLMNINTERITKGNLVVQGMLDLSVSDTLTFKMASNISSEVRLESYVATASEPAIPSVSLLINKVDDDGGL